MSTALRKRAHIIRAAMPRSFEGDHNAEGLRFAVIASRFNDEIVDGLLRGALDCLARHGAAGDDVAVYRVPGAFEIPTLAAKLIDVDDFDAIVTLGCLLRGDTPHFDFISAQVTNDLSRVATEAKFPIAFGVITCNTLEQAVARSSAGSGNKGWEAALAAIEMANLWRALRSEEM
jgi:6,7-dimethyl-8-ribityllumazine synthase